MIMRKRNVLIFPAGTEIGLEINAALRQCKEVNLFGAGQNLSNHAEFLYPQYHVLPSVFEKSWLPELNALIEKLQIDYIFPAHDDVIVALANAEERIPSAIISSSAQTCATARSKSRTYKALQGKVRVPKIYASQQEVDSYPVFVKPDCGQGSQNTFYIHSIDELKIYYNRVPEPIICEYLPGEEYTVDCFSDRERGLLFASARVRSRIRNGISVSTKTVTLPEAWDIADAIGRTLPFRGAWFFQLKRSYDGELVLLEVAPRIAGSMAAHRVLGVNFPMLSIYEHERVQVQIMPIDAEVEMDRALSNRYRHNIDFETLYIDLDDTLILNGMVNLAAVKLIFWCLNHRKKVTLVTRHKGELQQTLSDHHLSGLFDEIILIPPLGLKSDIIKEANAIFVDDSFSERMEVFLKCGILTFDCSMLELFTEQAPVHKE